MREMRKYDFWELIGETRELHGQDMDAFYDYLVEELKERGPQQAQDFHDIFHAYQDLANQYGLWSAASILCGGCTDDGFLDFRAWLIAQGGNVYRTALNNPDSLADVEPYGGCRFESLTYVGGAAFEALTGRDIYDGPSDATAYKTLVTELEQDIVYGVGIGYPYAQNELAAAFPRLCARYMTPEEISGLAERGPTWNSLVDEIKAARAAGPKDAPVRRPWADEAAPPKPVAERDVEKIIAAMKEETFREIQNDSGFPEGQLAWYWSYLGSLDMAQQLGLITDDRRQALYREAEPYKPDCVVTTRAFEPESEANTEMKIGGGMT